VDIVLMGDLNFHYALDLSLSQNPVKYLEDLFQMKQLVTEHTRVSNSSASTIDIILTTIPAQHKVSGVCKIALSDHFMCYTLVEDKKIKKDHKTITFRDFKQFSCDNFRNDVAREVNSLNLCDFDSLHDRWLAWKNTFIGVCNKHAPTKTCRVRTRHNPWITHEVIKLMYKRDYLHNKATKSKDDQIWSDYKKIRNLVNRTIQKNKHDYYSSVIDNHKENTKRFWKEMAKIMPNKLNTSSIPNTITVEELNMYFSTIGSSTVAKHHGMNNHNELPPWKGSKSIYKFEFNTVPEQEIFKLLNNLSAESSVDILGFDAKLLKLSARIIAKDVSYFINQSIVTGEVIGDWKLARVTPIYKGKGDRLDPGNYRPISVICHIAKLLEKVVCKQLLNYLTDHKFITTDQSAYLKNHSTQTSLHRVVDDWLDAMNEGELVGVCFLDIAKCFDTIDHSFLCTKLTYYGICDNELTWFKSYLRNRKQKVASNGKLSTEAQVDIGVPQGSILGPFLFLLYANDLSNYVLNGTCNSFADDTIIYVTAKTVEELRSKLQTCLNGVQEWYTQNKLAINVNKSNVMVLTTQQKYRSIDLSQFQIFYNGTMLAREDQVKYLGIIFDSCLTWHNQIANIYKNIGPKLSLIRRLSKSLPHDLLNQIYKTYVLPILEYGCTVWGLSSEQNADRIQKLHNLLARTITQNYDFVHTRGINIVESLKWQTFKQRRDYLLCNLMYKCVYGTAPDYLVNNITLASDIGDITTRQNQSLNLHIPLLKIEKFRNTLSYTGAQLWNQLPNELKQCSTLCSFKTNYKKLLWESA
jgi:hypothetical protein